MVNIKSSTYPGYYMKVETPKRFKEDKKSLKFKEWKRKKEIKYDEKVNKHFEEEWWKSKTPERKKELLKMYKTVEIAKSRYRYWNQPIGRVTSKKLLKL